MKRSRSGKGKVVVVEGSKSLLHSRFFLQLSVCINQVYSGFCPIYFVKFYYFFIYMVG